MSKTIINDGPKTRRQWQVVVMAMTPLKMIGEPEHIAQVVAMLIDNEFMTGETVM